MIARAQESQDSQTSVVISAHRGRKGRRGGIEFKVHKVRRNRQNPDNDTVIGSAFWQPEASLSQSKITAYWNQQMSMLPPKVVAGSKPKVPGKEEGAEVANSNTSESVPREVFSEGNHCFIKKNPSSVCSSGSGESGGDSQIKLVERKYPEVQALELSHCFNYGNWRVMKSLTTRTSRSAVTVWKCADCGVRMQKVHRIG